MICRQTRSGRVLAVVRLFGSVGPPLAVLLVALALMSPTLLLGAPVDRKPPVTRADDVKDVLHGVDIADPFRWLEDQESPETRAWIDEQNKYSHSFIDGLKARKVIEERMLALVKSDNFGIPFSRNGRYFFTKRPAGQDLFVIYMRKGSKGEDRALVDPHGMSADKTKSVDIFDVSDDGTLMAYSVRDGGQDEVAVRLLNVDSTKLLPDSLPRALYFSFSLLPDKSGYYYTIYKPEGPRLFFHKMGTVSEEDVMVFGEGYGPDKIVGGGVTEDGRYLGIIVYHGSAGQKTEVHFQDLVKKGPIQVVVDDIDARFEPQIGGDKLYMLTNWNAPNGRVLAVDLNNPARDNWEEVVPESDDVIEGMALAGGRIFLNYLHNVASKVAIYEPDGKPVRDIALPSLGYISNVVGRWQGDETFFFFTSFDAPSIIYSYDVKTGRREVWAKRNVPFNPDMFEVKQVWYASKDGTKIPMFIVHKKGLKLDGNNPVYLTGYGGFTVHQTPYYSACTVVWVEHGGVFARPSLRG
ncbi:MAG: S9 family peptidase, partial [Candidatus Eisenbacteria bacterium]